MTIPAHDRGRALYASKFMNVSPATAVTARGVRDGDPRALAAVCDRRGASVLAYCRQVCTADEAEEAAAETFASFRSGVIAADSLAALDPEALLLHSTRHAAAAHAPRPATGAAAGALAMRRPPSRACLLAPELLVARVERTLSESDRERFARHVRRCSTCRATAERFAAGERAYRDPSPSEVPSDLAAMLIGALADVAPAPATNGHGHLATDVDTVERAETLRESRSGVATVQDLGLAPTTAIPRIATHPRGEPVPAAAGLGPRIVLPGAVIATGLLVTLGIAGVFSSDSPSSSADPASQARAVRPAVASTALPGAGTVSTIPSRLATFAREAREARARRQRAAATAPAATQDSSDTTADEPPAASPPVQERAPAQRQEDAPLSVQKVQKPSRQGSGRGGAPAGDEDFQPGPSDSQGQQTTPSATPEG
jgi:hypothetical protein